VSEPLRGRPGAPGIALATAWLYRPKAPGTGPRRTLDEVVDDDEAELAALAGGLRDAGRSEESAILDAQALMARDDTLLADAAARIAAAGFEVETFSATEPDVHRHATTRGCREFIAHKR